MSSYPQGWTFQEGGAWLSKGSSKGWLYVSNSIQLEVASSLLKEVGPSCLGCNLLKILKYLLHTEGHSIIICIHNIDLSLGNILSLFNTREILFPQLPSITYSLTYSSSSKLEQGMNSSCHLWVDRLYSEGIFSVNGLAWKTHLKLKKCGFWWKNLFVETSTWKKIIVCNKI